MGRKKKAQEKLECDSIQLVYRADMEKEWLRLVTEWAVQEMQNQIKGGTKEE